MHTNRHRFHHQVGESCDSKGYKYISNRLSIIDAVGHRPIKQQYHTRRGGGGGQKKKKKGGGEGGGGARGGGGAKKGASAKL